jgi:hypothetical protein
MNMTRGHKRGSGERSNWYSESKCSNWGEYDPFLSEIIALPPWIDPFLTVEVSDGTRIAVILRGPHPAFVHPVTPEEVKRVLLRVPPDYLEGLTAVYLLGGSARQAKIHFKPPFCFGSYGRGRIYLHAFSKRLFKILFKKPPPPDIKQEYASTGATWTQERRGWALRWSEESLRRFYLYDVLLHEVGHHVDRSNVAEKKAKALEGYANWFATFCVKEMRSAH